jgi:hypothetical protein
MPVPSLAQMQTSIETFYDDQQLLHSLVNGSNTTEVTVETGVLPSWAKFLLTMGALPSNTYSGLGTAYASDFTVTTSEAGQIMELAGNTLQKTITFGAPAGYANSHLNLLLNNSARGWKIVISGQSTRMLHPGNSLIVQKMGAGSPWKVIAIGKRYILPGGAQTFYTNFSTGSDTFGVNDGLSAANPFKTANNALYYILDQFELNATASAQSQVTVQLGAVDTATIHYSPRGAQLGSQGGAAIKIDLNGFGIQPATGSAIQCYYPGCVLQVRNGFLQTTNSHNVEADWGARIEFLDGMEFIGSGSHVSDIRCLNKAHVTLDSDYEITGSRSYHILNTGGIVEAPSAITITLNNGMAVSQWVLGTMHARTNFHASNTYVNGATISGPEHSTTLCSVLTGISATNFPGNSAGSADSTSFAG